MKLGLPLLAGIPVTSVANEPTVVLHNRVTASEALIVLREAGVPGAPVIDSSGYYLGTVDGNVLVNIVSRSPDAAVDKVLDATTGTVSVDATLDVGLEALLQAGGGWIAVTDDNRRVIGILSLGDIVRGYRRAIESSIGQLSRIGAHAIAIEVRVGPSSAVIGRSIRDAGLPARCLLITIQRGKELLFPTASTTLAEGDIVNALVDPGSAAALSRLLRGTAERDPTGSGDGAQLI
jgi:CIC family chloride channel protein